MGYTTDSFGKPVFSKSPTQTVVDLQAAADFAGEFANVRVGTASERGALTPGEIHPGMLFSESDTGKILVALAGGGWRVVDTPDTGWVSLGALSAGWTETVAAKYRVRGGVVYFNGQLSSTGAGSGPFTGLLPVGARPAMTHAFLALTTAASLRNAYVASTGYMDLGAGAVANIILSAIPPYPAA